MKDDSKKPASSRRNFLKQTGVATAGLVASGLLSRTASALPPLPSNPATVDAMPTRNLGRTGYRAGIFSLPRGQACVRMASSGEVRVVARAGISPQSRTDTTPAATVNARTR